MEYRFISADDHIDLRWLPKDLWTERLPASLRERGPHVVENEKGASGLGKANLQPAWLLHRRAGERRHVGDRTRWRDARGRAASDNRRTRLTDMDSDGADASVMYGPTDPMAIADPELRRCCYEAYNDWLIDFCAASRSV